jgi:hypothetical protein
MRNHDDDELAPPHVRAQARAWARTNGYDDLPGDGDLRALGLLIAGSYLAGLLILLWVLFA